MTETAQNATPNLPEDEQDEEVTTGDAKPPSVTATTPEPSGTLHGGVPSTDTLVQLSTTESQLVNTLSKNSSEYSAQVAFGTIVIDDDAVRRSMAEAYKNKNEPRSIEPPPEDTSLQS